MLQFPHNTRACHDLNRWPRSHSIAVKAQHLYTAGPSSSDCASGKMSQAAARQPWMCWEQCWLLWGLCPGSLLREPAGLCSQGHGATPVSY